MSDVGRLYAFGPSDGGRLGFPAVAGARGVSAPRILRAACLAGEKVVIAAGGAMHSACVSESGKVCVRVVVVLVLLVVEAIINVLVLMFWLSSSLLLMVHVIVAVVAAAVAVGGDIVAVVDFLFLLLSLLSFSFLLL